MNNFDKKNASKEALFFYKKYVDQTIWTQTFLEGENLELSSVQAYFNPSRSPRTPLNKIFTEQENVSEYTLELLNCLKNGWDFIGEKLNKANKEFLNLDDLIVLNYKLSKCDGNSGGLRQRHVRISGTSYHPKTPINGETVENDLNRIINANDTDLNKGLNLFLYGCKTQIFNDGNKRTSLLNASFYLISNGVINQFWLPRYELKEFRDHLIAYYENEDHKDKFKEFLKKKCLTYTNNFKQTKEYKNIFNPKVKPGSSSKKPKNNNKSKNNQKNRKR